MKIDRIYSRFQRGGRYYLIARVKRARVKRDGEFTIEQVEVTERQYRTMKEGDVV